MASQKFALLRLLLGVSPPGRLPIYQLFEGLAKARYLLSHHKAARQNFYESVNYDCSFHYGTKKIFCYYRRMSGNVHQLFMTRRS